MNRLIPNRNCEAGRTDAGNGACTVCEKSRRVRDEPESVVHITVPTGAGKADLSRVPCLHWYAGTVGFWYVPALSMSGGANTKHELDGYIGEFHIVD